MELEVYKLSGGKTAKKVKLSETIYGIDPNDHAIWLDVRQYLNNQRQGTAKTKERNEITGSRRKIKRQKGTGTARAGDIKNPIFRGGGRVFGPEPRDYNMKLNKKLKRLARKSALTYKMQENGITIVEDFQFEEPRTKEYLAMLRNFELEGKKSLLVLADSENNVFLSSRNIQRAKVTRADSLNTYDILNANRILISESSVDIIEKLLG